MVPDIVLLGAEWNPRTLLRAQLIEEGFEVLATDDWPTTRRYLRPGSKPKLLIVDLKGLPEPRQVLDDLRVLMKPERVLVFGATATLPPTGIRAMGFRTMARPVCIADIVAEANRTAGAEAR